jgi:hypothetical protein
MLRIKIETLTASRELTIPEMRKTIGGCDLTASDPSSDPSTAGSSDSSGTSSSVQLLGSKNRRSRRRGRRTFGN